MKEYQSKEVESYVGGLTSFQKELVLAIREVVLSADEQIKEGIKWSSIAFYNKKNICGFRIAKAHVTLLFMEGASLNDKHGIFQGTGAKARTYKLTDINDLKVNELTDLVKQAIEAGM